jgi:DNA-binding transcriptional MocR family regulator
MTFLPIVGARRPIYRAIAEEIERAVVAGEVGVGERLPTQRELARSLGVTVATVTRAYGIAERRGIISTEVGRGTFVRPMPFDTSRKWRGVLNDEGPGTIDLSRNELFPYAQTARLAAAFRTAIEAAEFPRLLEYQPSAGSLQHREAGASWIRRRGVQLTSENVLVTVGAQHAMLVALATLCAPGDTVLVEDATYAGMRTLARTLHLSLVGLPQDELGIIPDALARVAAHREKPVLYCMPSLQNPTGASMSAARRAHVAEVCERHEVTVIEDDSYGFLVDDVPPLAVTVPDRTVYLTGTSKSLAPGLRVGFLAAPTRLVESLASAICSTIWLGPPFMADVVARCIADGTADHILAWKREEIVWRQSAAATKLDGYEFHAHPRSFHVWLQLPGPWRADEFTREAHRRGVVVNPAGDFLVERDSPAHAVRICLGSPATREELEQGLDIVVETLGARPEPRRGIV